MINQYSEIREEVEEEEKEKTPLGPMIKAGFSVVGLIVCLGMLIGGILTFAFSLKVLTYKSVEAQISSFITEEKGEYTVFYKVGEKEYINSIETEKEYKEEDKITVYYNPKDPDKIALDKMPNLIAIVFAIVGGILLKFIIPLIPKYAKEIKGYYKEFEDEDEE